MAPRIWVVVAASRPDKVWRVLANYRAQEYGNKGLVVVENGKAVDAYSDLEEVSVRMTSKQHPGAARNVALRWLKKNHPRDYWVSMDDDDYYGRSYLTEHAEKAERGTVRGKWAGWTKFDNELVYFGNSWKPDTDREHLFGGTLGAYISESPLFPEDTTIGEDSDFCRRALRDGLKVKTLSSAHFCASREGDANTHTHKASDQKYWRRFGRLGVRVVGDWGDMVEREPPEGPLEKYGA